MKRVSFLFFGLIFWVGACSLQKTSLPDLGALPDFSLTDQNGQNVGLSQYRDKVWVANFIFTSCAGTCPLLTQRMKRVQEAIIKSGEGTSQFQIVSFSVDPERDTPERLKQYAEEYGALPQVWSFLTGSMDQINRTVVQGFKIAMGKVKREDAPVPPTEGEIFDVVHGEKFVLVDGKGRIRGYYDSDRDGITRLIKDMKSL